MDLYRVFLVRLFQCKSQDEVTSVLEEMLLEDDLDSTEISGILLAALDRRFFLRWQDLLLKEV